MIEIMLEVFPHRPAARAQPREAKGTEATPLPLARSK